MACAERAEHLRFKTLTGEQETCHGRSFRDGQTMTDWFVPPVVVPLFSTHYGGDHPRRAVARIRARHTIREDAVPRGSRTPPNHQTRRSKTAVRSGEYDYKGGQRRHQYPGAPNQMMAAGMLAEHFAV